MSKAWKQAIESLEDLLEVMKSDEPIEKYFNVRSYPIPAPPNKYDGPAIREIRDRIAMSQALFAKFLCVSTSTVQSWEQGKRTPSPIARRFLDEISADPEKFRQRFAVIVASPGVASKA
jgi:putative transcriptional regulator